MLTAWRKLIRRTGFVGVLLLTFGLAMPAFEAHACADELSPPTVEAMVDLPAGSDVQCPDCGPACANGCCHASHAAVAPEILTHRPPAVFAASAGWSHVEGVPLGDVSGPDRPPRA